MQNKNLFLLWTGKLVSGLGDRMYAIAIAWWILELTGSPTIMGFYLLAATLPMVLFGLVAGAVIDKSNLKRVLIIADVVRGIGITLLGVLFLLDSLSLAFVFCITVVLSLASAFFNPAITSIIPRIVSENEYGKSNSIIQLVDGIAKVAGPFAGVAIVAVSGYSGAFLINGISFLVSAFIEGFIQYENKKIIWSKNSASRLNRIAALVNNIKSGIIYVLQNVKLINLLFYIFVAHFFVGALSVLIPVMAKFVSDNNLNLLGILETVFGAGFISGALVLGHSKQKNFNIDSLPQTFFLIGLSIIGIGFIAFFDRLPVILFTIPVFVIGYCIVHASINWKTFIQTNVPTSKLGRVSAFTALIGDITLPLAFALYGILLEQINFVLLVIFSGVILIFLVYTLNRVFSKKLNLIPVLYNKGL